MVKIVALIIVMTVSDHNVLLTQTSDYYTEITLHYANSVSMQINRVKLKRVTKNKDPIEDEKTPK